MKKVLIGCGILMALVVVGIIALIVFAKPIFTWAVGDNLVGSIMFENVDLTPESPTPDDNVLIKVGVAFAGVSFKPPAEGLQFEVTAQRLGDPESKSALVKLNLAAGAGPSGVSQGTVTIDLGKLPEGDHTITLTIQPPKPAIVGAVEPPREVRVVVKKKEEKKE